MMKRSAWLLFFGGIVSALCGAEVARLSVGGGVEVALSVERMQKTRDYALTIIRDGEAPWVCWQGKLGLGPPQWDTIVDFAIDGDVLGVRLGSGEIVICVVVVNLKERSSLVYSVWAPDFLRIERAAAHAIRMTKPYRLEVKDGDGRMRRIEFRGDEVWFDLNVVFRDGEIIYPRDPFSDTVLSVRQYVSPSVESAHRPMRFGRDERLLPLEFGGDEVLFDLNKLSLLAPYDPPLNRFTPRFMPVSPFATPKAEPRTTGAR